MNHGVTKEISKSELRELGFIQSDTCSDSVNIILYSNKVVYNDGIKCQVSYKEDLDLKVQIKFWGL